MEKGQGLQLTGSTGLQEGFGLHQTKTTGTTRDQDDLVGKVEFGKTLSGTEESGGFLAAFEVHVFLLRRLRGAAGLGGEALLVEQAWMFSSETLITEASLGSDRPLLREVRGSRKAPGLKLAGETGRDVEFPGGCWPGSDVGQARGSLHTSSYCGHDDVWTGE